MSSPLLHLGPGVFLTLSTVIIILLAPSATGDLRESLLHLDPQRDYWENVQRDDGETFLRPVEEDSWHLKYRETKAYTDYLLRNERAKPLSMRLGRDDGATIPLDWPLGCQDNCPSVRNVTLKKSDRPKLVVQVMNYLKADQMLLVSNEVDKETCFAIGRILYRLNVPATCTSLDSLYGYYTSVLLIANDQDTGRGISRVLKTVAQRVEANQLIINNLMILLPLSTTFLRPPPEYRINYCVLQTKGPGVEFREVFTFGPTMTSPVEEVVAWWIPGNDVESYIPYRNDLAIPRDFKGNIVTVTFIEIPPYVVKYNTTSVTPPTTTTTTSRSTVTTAKDLHINGIFVDLCQLIGKELNFTINWMEPADGEFGVPRGGDINNFTGTVGNLQRKEADLSVPLNINAPRGKAIDYSPPIDYAFTKILIFRDGSTQDMDWYTYIMGFHWSVWLTLVGVWIVMAVGIAIVARNDYQVTVYNYLFTFIGALAQQGSAIEPESGRGRLVFFTFWLASVIIYTSYTASLTSQLAVVYKADPFTSLKEALTTAGYSVALQRGTSYYTTVEEMAKTNKVMKLFLEQLQRTPELNVLTNAEGFSLVQTRGKKYAFLQDTESIDFEIKNNCSYSWMGPPYFPDFTYIGYTKNLSYANAVSHVVLKAMDSGIMQKLMKKWMGRRIPCTSSALQILGMSKTVSAFTLLAVGMTIAMILLLFEKCAFRSRSMTWVEATMQSLQQEFPEVKTQKKVGDKDNLKYWPYDDHAKKVY